MKRVLTALLGSTILGIASLPAQAAILSVTPGGAIIPAPDAALDSMLSDPALMLGFNERQGVVLTRDIEIDDPDNGPADWVYDPSWSGIIPEGKTVDSHMILLNQPTEQGGTLELDNIEWTFDGMILGVMSDRNGVRESMSTDLLGASGTLYPTIAGPDVGALPDSGATFSGFDARGIENYVDGVNFYEIVDSNTLSVDMRVTQPGDWIRVVTMVPEPGSVMALFALGALGAAGTLKRKQQ